MGHVRAVVVLVLVLLAGCGEAQPEPPTAGAPVPGGALSVEEALQSELDEPLLVRGSLLAFEGEPVRLCSGFMESDPPQCVEPSLLVEGLDLTEVDTHKTGDVRFADGVELLGRVEDGTLMVSEQQM